MAWPKNERAEDMYALYLSGASLQGVATAYGMTRQSVHGLFKYRGWETRKPRAPLKHQWFNGEKYTLRNNGYYGKTRGARTMMHRDVWEASNGTIPEGYDIHHKDGNRMNNTIENLECLPKSEHTRLYSPHNNQHTKGK